MSVVTHSWRYLAVTVLLLHFFAFSGSMRAQDTLHLKEVAVSVVKIKFGATGKKQEQLDSLALTRFHMQSLGQALATESSMHIKSYGPGGLTTTTFRGGSAAQTAVVWNGINIQSRMLGQLDLSLLPAFLFDAVTIQYGSSSALWGSGAVGGSILMNSKTAFGKGRASLLTAGAGSFGNTTAGIKQRFSSDKFVSTTKVWWRQAKNDFNYQQPDESVILRARHAAYHQKGLQQELRYKISNNRIFSINAWFSTADRELPSFQGSGLSAAKQSDRNHRIVAELEQGRKNFITHFKAAFLHERLVYSDSLVSAFSDSKVNTFLAETDNYWHWGRHVLNFGISASSSQAQATAYGTLRQQSFLTAIAANTFRFFGDRLHVQVHLRQDVYLQGAKPFTFNLGVDQKIGNFFSAHLNFAKVYRHPTLNEWYWQPGGNPALLPESGFSSEGHLAYNRSFARFHMQFTAAAFSRQMKNWILWVPGAGGNASPLNLQNVWSRGSETSSKVSWTSGGFTTGFCLRTAYVLSTIESSALPEDASLHKQLIYTPRYTGNGTFFLQYHRLRLDYTQLYVGYRFTSSDNVNWLKPYGAADLRASIRLDAASHYLVSFLCTNLFNQPYAVVQGRPAALRYYEFTFTWQPKI